MTIGLLDVATVLEGDGHWTAGYETDALACGRQFVAVDVCTPATITPPNDAGTGFKIVPFALTGQQRFGQRCMPEDSEDALRTALDDASEYMVAKAFWNGSSYVTNWVTQMWLGDAGIATVASGATPQDTAGALIAAAYAAHPEIDPILHVGMTASLKIPTSWFDQVEVDLCISPGYPPNGMAITGPIVVHLGSIEILEGFASERNRNYFAATRLAAIDFDPCLAIRAV